VPVIDPKTLTIKRNIKVGIIPIAIDVNPVTKHLYVGNYGSSTISVIDSLTKTVVSSISVYKPVDLAVNSKTNRIYSVSGDPGRISVIDGAINKVISTIII
jgi:YVTN family beta-propeller protein